MHLHETFVSLKEDMLGVMIVPPATRFSCPQCGAQYRVVRVEAPEITDVEEVACISCEAAFVARDGRFALKYFLVEPGEPQPRRNR